MANYREEVEEKEKQLQQAMVEVQTLSSKLTEDVGGNYVEDLRC